MLVVIRPVGVVTTYAAAVQFKT